MRKIAVLIASAAINAATIPAPAAEFTSNYDASRARWATLHSQLADAPDKDKICQAYAASFYRSAVLRQAAAGRVEGERVLAVLDSVINAFHDLFATKCGG